MHDPMTTRRQAPGTSFVGKVCIAVSIVALALLAWRLSNMFVLLFGAVVVATVLRALGRLAERWLRVSENWSSPVAILFVAVVLGAAGWLIGDRLAQQLVALRETLPSAVDAAGRWLDGSALGSQVRDALGEIQDQGMPWGRLVGIAGTTASALGNALLVLLVGIYLSLSPDLYRRGLLRLMPLERRQTVSEALDAAGEALTRWLMGQGLSMLFVGLSTGIGLWALGMPMALTLGILAALLDFVPLLGPIAAGVIAVTFAFIEGPQQALYVAILCLVIQQMESYLLMPVLQRWAVSLPPVLGLLAVVAFGVLLGVPGLVFATPLIVVLMVLVQKLYVEAVIEAPPHAPL